jgi:hypothetical protein
MQQVTQKLPDVSTKPYGVTPQKAYLQKVCISSRESQLLSSSVLTGCKK